MTADEYFAKIGFKLSYLMEAYEKFKRETGKINEAYEHREYVKKKNKEGIPKKIFTLHRKVAQ